MSDQQPDQRPGPYYVTAIYGSRFARLSGPYPAHADALANVDHARHIASDMDPRASFWAYGTARMVDETRPGVLQQYGHSLKLEAPSTIEVVR